MSVDFSCGPHSAALWRTVAPIIARIEALPFLDQLAHGTLEARAFAFYLAQDGQYLTRYARALALLSAHAGERGEGLFWAESSARAVVAEEQMQAEVMADPPLAAARRQLAARGQLSISPTTLGYSSFLIASVATGAHAEGVAAVLPCFWIYAHVGKWLAAEAAKLRQAHPYRAWVELYDSALFDQATRQAVSWLEHYLQASPDALRRRMQACFEQACRWELLFWHDAHRLQDWSLVEAAACPA